MKPADGQSRQTSQDRLIEIGKLLLAATDVRGVADNIAHAICEATGYDRAVIAAIDSSSGQLVGRAGCGVPLSHVLQIRVYPEDVPVFTRIRAGTGAVVVGRSEVRSAIPHEYADLFAVKGTLVVSPLRSERLGLMGVIFADRAGKDFRPTATERQLLEDFSSLAALAFQNSILLEHSQVLARMVERRRIGTDLHDGVTQQLFGAELAVQELRDVPDLSPAALPIVDRLANHLTTANSQLRTALFELANADESPGADDPLGAWIRHHLESFVQETGVSADVEFHGAGREPLGRSREVVLRSVREGLANVAKHASATQVLVVVRSGLTWITVEVLDDGDGDEMAVRARLAKPNGLSFGLLSLANDTERLGGRLWISTAPRLGGLRLSVSVPVGAPENDSVQVFP